MPHWIFRLGRLFILKSKHVTLEDPPTIYEEQVHHTAECKPMKQLKTLGDVVDHLEKLKDLEKKGIKQPILGNKKDVHTDKKDRKPISLPVSRASPLTFPAANRHVNSSDCSADTWESTRQSQNIRQLFGSVKDHLAETIKRRKADVEKTVTRRYNSDVTQRTTISISDSSRKSARPSSREEIHEPWTHHILPHITPEGERKHSGQHISEVGESGKLTEGPMSILVTKPLPELHRSAEDFNRDFNPEKPTKIPGSDSKMNVARVAQDSLFTKSEESSIPIAGNVIPDTTEIESVGAMAARALSPIIPLERIVSHKKAKNGDTSTSSQQQQPRQQRQQKRGSTDGYVEGGLSKDEVIRKRGRSRKLRSSGKQKNHRDQASQTSEEEMGGNEHMRSPSAGSLSNGSIDSDWCRRICDEDRRIRKRSRTGAYMCVRRRYRSSHRTLRAGVFKCADRTDHRAVIQDLPLACSQDVRIKTNQADVVFEDLIRRLARDVADGMLSKATYARSITSRTHRRTALLVRALLGCQYPGTPDTSSTSLPVLSSSHKSISHTND